MFSNVPEFQRSLDPGGKDKRQKKKTKVKASGTPVLRQLQIIKS
jgi:hypothetical protein